jgi:hypothetical protein
MSASLQPGSIITFYSYKGGTGRTMALANIAWILASNGMRVLTIDWDLEAPGLHRFFAPFLPDPDLHESEGLIDLLLRYWVAASKPAGKETSGRSDWYRGYARVERFAEPLEWRFPKGGRIDMLGAGRQDDRYASRINDFDWKRFYEEFGGGALIDAIAKRAREYYNYVLIDSRTGVSDTSGICTVHLPDQLVVLYTLNNQSIYGATGVARSTQNQRNQKGRPIQIFPVASRIELAEKKKLRERRRLAVEQLSPLLDHLPNSNPSAYMGEMEILYDPFYAYEEVLATIADEPGVTNSVLSALERLTGHITNNTISKLAPVTPELREQAMTRYEKFAAITRGKTTLAEEPVKLYDVFIESASEDMMANRLFRDLAAECSVFLASESLRPGDDVYLATRAALESAKVIVIFSSSKWIDSRSSNIVLAWLVDANIQKPNLRIIPVADVTDSKQPQEMPPVLEKFNAFELRDQNDLSRLSDLILKEIGVRRRRAKKEPVLTVDRPSEPSPVESPKPPVSKAANGYPPMTARKDRATRRWLVAALLAIAILAATGYFTYQQWSEERNTERLVTSLLSASYQVRDENATLSLLLALEAVQRRPTNTAVTALRAALRASNELAVLPGPGYGNPLSIVFSPDGAQIVAVYTTAIRIFRVIEGRWQSQDPSVQPDSPILAARLGPSGHIALATREGWTRRWPDRRLENYDKSIKPVTAAWSQSLEELLLLPSTGSPSLLSGNGEYRLLNYEKTLIFNAASWSPSAGLIAMTDGEAVTAVADRAGKLIARLDGTPGKRPGDAWSLDARYLAIKEPKLAINVWQFERGPKDTGLKHSVVFMLPQKEPLRVVAWHPDGLRLATASEDQTFRVWSLEGIDPIEDGQSSRSPRAGKQVAVIPNVGLVNRIQWSPDGSKILTVSEGGLGSIWSVGSNAEPQRLRAKAGPMIDGVWSSDGTRIATFSADGSVRIWDPNPAALNLEREVPVLIELARQRVARNLTPEERKLYLEK